MTTNAAAPPLLVVEHLAVRRNVETLLDDVSLGIARGALHLVVGPNGAGKSTLLLAILGLLPFTGRILLNWRGPGRIGYVPQSFAVDPTLPVTVEDFLALSRQGRPVCLGLSSSTRRKVTQLLDRVGLASIARRPLAVLSGGELRRVLLAHALDPEPELLLLDEPTSGLDEAAARWFEETLLQIKRDGRTTIVMVSHDLEQARRIGDSVTVLDRRVVADGRAADLLAAASVRDLLPTARAGWALR
jgi:zinc transport system ATP-binding protein